MPLHEYQKQMYKKAGIVLAIVILPVAGFFAGVQYQRQTNPASTKGETGQYMGGTLPNRAIGTVQSISDANITITDRMSNANKTYTIDSSTTYKNGTADAQASDIKANDNVMLVLDSSDASKVKTVTINPTLRGGGPETINTQ